MTTLSDDKSQGFNPASTLIFQAPEFSSVPASPAFSGDEPETNQPQRAKRKRLATRDRRSHNNNLDVPNGADVQKNFDGENAPQEEKPRRRRRVTENKSTTSLARDDSQEERLSDEESGSKRRRRRRRITSSHTPEQEESGALSDQVRALKGSTRLEAKKRRRRESHHEVQRSHVITETEFIARREAVERKMIIRLRDGLDQIAILEDDVLVEHYVSRHTHQSMVGNIYLGRVQNVLPSMEAAFIDIGRGRNAVLYAGEVNWDAFKLEGRPRRMESALSSGDAVLVQVTKDPIGHKGARLTSQITLAGRYLVLNPSGSMMGISRKLPEGERSRLKKILKKIIPDSFGVIVRTAAEGVTEKQLSDDVQRLVAQWEDIEEKQKKKKSAPILLRGEPELAVRVVRDIFNEDFSSLKIQGTETYNTVKEYVEQLSPELSDRVQQWTGSVDIFEELRIDEQLAKGMDHKVWLPSGGTLVIDRTEAMTVIDVNTGKYIGAGGTLEETVTRNNLEAAEEIVRQLRLRDIGGIIIIDFVDMVLESNQDLVLRQLMECLSRDRTRHQVTEITSLGLVQMTRKRVGEGLVESFSTQCEVCEGKGFIVHKNPVEIAGDSELTKKSSRHKKNNSEHKKNDSGFEKDKTKKVISAIAAATIQLKDADHEEHSDGLTSDNTHKESADCAFNQGETQRSQVKRGRARKVSHADSGKQRNPRSREVSLRKKVRHPSTLRGRIKDSRADVSLRPTVSGVLASVARTASSLVTRSRAASTGAIIPARASQSLPSALAPIRSGHASASTAVAVTSYKQRRAVQVAMRSE